MASDGQIVFEVTADGKHAIADIKEITKAIEKESKKWDAAAEESTDSIESSFSGMVKKIAAGISAAKIGKALLNIGKEALQAASDLEEVQNVVDTTFGASASQIESWAKTAGTQFGLTETQAKRFTSTMGAMLKSSGLAGDQIVSMSTDLAGLAADMASFYNLDFDEAFQKIRSGISGETEPLKQLGINMSTANLEAYALQKGLSKTWNQMSQGEQIMLRYQYLMSATADAQGDFAKTSTGYANALRTMETNVESLKTKLGEILLPEISKVVNSLNTMLEKLAPVQEDTVMDQLSAVNLKTAEKLEEIGKTADQARALTKQLSEIENTKAGDGVQKIVDKLSTVDLTQGNAGAVNDFLSVLYENIENVASVRGESVEEAKAWLDGLAASANKLDPGKGENWKALLEAITGGLPGLEDTEEGQKIIDALELENGSIKRYLEALGIDSSEIADKQSVWLEVCRRLVQTLPGLSSIIDTQTGEIKGGIQAVNDYIDTWEAAEERAALLAEIAEEKRILSERYSDRFSMKVDVVQAEANVERLRKKLESFSKEVKESADRKDMNQALWGGSANYTEEEQEYLDTMVALSAATRDLSDKQAKLNSYMDEYEKGVAFVEDRENAVLEKYPEMENAIEEAAEASKEWGEEQKQAAQTAVAAAQESLKALADYAQGVRSSVQSAVNSVVSGFKRIKSPTADLYEQSSKLAEEEINNLEKYKDVWNKWGSGPESLKKMSDSWNKLTAREQEAYNALVQIHNEQYEVNKQLSEYSPSGMKSALESQLTFMTQYLDNLEKAQAMGLSNEMLAMLSDGSVESAEMLKNLVANPEAAKEVDSVLQEVGKKKEEFVNKLTDTQLVADELWKSMLEEAQTAVAGLDMESDAATNAGKTVTGMAQGIADHVPEVQSAVDSLLAELNRLSGWGINIDLGSFGSFGINLSTPDGSHANGLDYVPFNGYLAELHQGEAILTAQEAQVWRMAGIMNNQDGGIGSDTLNALLGTHLEGVKAGGNVYLDGRVVGDVISAQQGRAYRQLQRSGWQQ